ncbi:MAG: AIPR family protein [Candidatus Peribacteraceae bacterium]
MTDSDFQKQLDKEVEALAQEFSITPPRAFLLWLGMVALSIEKDDAYAAVQFDGSNDKHIDFFWVDEDHEKVIIKQGKYSKKAKTSDLDAFLGCTDWLEASPETLRREGRPDLADLAEQYNDAVVQREFSVELWFAYRGPEDPNLERRARIYNQKEDSILHHRSAHVVHSQKLKEYYQEAIGTRRRVKKASITLSTPAFYEQSSKAYGKALIATVPGASLASLYSTFGDQLFDRNVRLFLGTKGTVNAGIDETLQDQRERPRFWAYNNGVTIVCDSFALDPATLELQLRNFSIVNGCQTTVSLSKQVSILSDDVQVLLKVISPPELVIDSIIRYTNSQNPIKVWDIASQDRRQRHLRDEFMELKKPCLYLLRRGELAKSKSSKPYPGGVLKHDLLAQYLASFNGDPSAAFREKSLLFTPKYYERIFPRSLRVAEALFIWNAGECVMEAVRSAIRDAAANNQEEEVRILKKGGKLFALGAFGVIARKHNGENLLGSITEERCTSESARERLRKYASIAVTWYVMVAKDLTGGKDFAALIRERTYFRDVEGKIIATYKTYASDAKVLKQLLPRIF